MRSWKAGPCACLAASIFFHRYTPPPRRELSSNRKALWIKFGLACHTGTVALNLFRISSRLIPSGIFHSTISVIMIVTPVTQHWIYTLASAFSVQSFDHLVGDGE